MKSRFLLGERARNVLATALGTATDFVNLLQTIRNLLYIRNQSVPRCKHFPPWL